MPEKNDLTQFVPCPLCFGEKIKEPGKDFLMCGDCHQRFVQEAAAIALTGATAPTKAAWGEEKIKERIPELKANLEEAQRRLAAVEENHGKRIAKIFLDRVGGQTLDAQVADAAKKRVAQEQGNRVWNELGGPKAFRNSKVAEARLKEALRLLEDIERQKEAPPPPGNILNEVKRMVDGGDRGNEDDCDKAPRKRPPREKGGRAGEKVRLNHQTEDPE